MTDFGRLIMCAIMGIMVWWAILDTGWTPMLETDSQVRVYTPDQTD